MRDLNQMLEEYVEVPKAGSLPKYKYIPSPTGEMSPDNEEEYALMMQELYSGSRYEFDTSDYERSRH